MNSIKGLDVCGLDSASKDRVEVEWHEGLTAILIYSPSDAFTQAFLCGRVRLYV